MKIERRHIKSLTQGLVLLIVTVLMSVLLVMIIRVNPPLVFFIFLFPADLIPFPYNLSGLLVIGLGLLLNAYANYTLLFVGKISLRNREPFHVPSTLVVEGPYRFSRNPVYMSVLTLIIGAAVILSSLLLIIILAVVFAIFRYFIHWEEKRLEDEFGNDYLEYKKRVRRWV